MKMYEFEARAGIVAGFGYIMRILFMHMKVPYMLSL